MGGQKKPSLPDAPEFKADPRVSSGIDQLFGIGTQATNLDFTGKMAETIETSPDITSLYLQGLRAELEPIYSDLRRESTNILAAQGQLSGSTLPSALADIENKQRQEYIRQSSQFGINDINRALENRMRLYGLGTQTIGTATGYAGENEARINNFNLQNYENQLAKAIGESGSQQGGWGGALQGAMSGGMAGSAAGPYGMIGGAVLGGTAGYFSQSGSGASYGSGLGSMIGGLGSMGSGGLSSSGGTATGVSNPSYWDSIRSGGYGSI